MAILLEPTIDEMSFRKKLYENKKTMAPHDIEPFPNQQWKSFVENHILVDPKEMLYRFEFCDGCMEFTAETYWQWDKDISGYVLHILVRGDMRREGYGDEALRLMKIEAKKYNIHRFYAEKPMDEGTEQFLKHEHFQIMEDGSYWYLDF